MDLLSGKLYWPTTFPEAPAYPPLKEDIDCDVLIIGCGSTGAQCAYRLSDTGQRVVMVDKRKPGGGSTACNTGLVQFMGDKMLFELADSFGEAAAIRHAKLSEQAVKDIDAAARDIPIDCEFSLRDSLYTASTTADVEKLKRDFDLMVPGGFRVDWWSDCTIEDYYPFTRPAALYVRDDAELNPYKYTIGLLEKARERGVLIFGETEITGRTDEPEAAVFRTNNRHRIRAGQAVMAAGYENLEFRQDRNATMASTYAVVTEPVDNLTDWYRRVLIWETARPYVYMRTTPDNRIIIGGLDENTSVAAERDGKILAKKDQLMGEFRKLFPAIEARAEYRFGAFFGGTRDGLPMIGRYADFPRCSYVYAYGDNGLVYGMIAAKMLRDELTGNPNPDIGLYRPGRRAYVKSS